MSCLSWDYETRVLAASQGGDMSFLLSTAPGTIYCTSSSRYLKTQTFLPMTQYLLDNRHVTSAWLAWKLHCRAGIGSFWLRCLLVPDAGHRGWLISWMSNFLIINLVVGMTTSGWLEANSIVFRVDIKSYVSLNLQSHHAQQRSDMLLLITQGIITYAIFWGCWRILRRLVVKTDLHNIPGPASDSFLKGECRFVFRYSLHVQSMRIGNFSKIVNTNAWSFHKELGQKCTSCIPHPSLGMKTRFISDQTVGSLWSMVSWVYELARRMNLVILLSIPLGEAALYFRSLGLASCRS